MEQSATPINLSKDQHRMIVIKKEILEYQEKIKMLQREYQAIKQKTETQVESKVKEHKKERRIRSFEFQPSKVDFSQMVQDKYSKIRLHDMPFDQQELDERMYDRKYVPINNIENTMQDGDINEDWVTIGVVYEQTEPFAVDGGMKIQCLSLTDFQPNGTIRLFLKGSDCVQTDNMLGKVIAILNCDISKPTQNNAELALTLTSSLLLMEIGKSVDLGFCSGGGKEQCKQFLDRRAAKYCAAHQVAIYQQARNKRQEFATGDRLFTVGNPENKHEKKKAFRQHDRNASYQIGKHTIVAQGNSVQIYNPPKQPSERILTEKEKAGIAMILNSNSHGGKVYRKMMGIEEDENRVNVFGPNALMKMGGDPHQIPKKKPKLSQPDSDSECELEII
ncbi:minichromosome maintenance- protein [Boothiomyces macroporosus]|uniref:Minichromosome maintenance- protein n=1 Tax=Boothiomyces macroporosus TaxID=261099 RepID=A0AAD5ULR7_9FUNG|nr:minichromosome maintenance- protein [Boothiomyces macroporosus]